MQNDIKSSLEELTRCAKDAIPRLQDDDRASGTICTYLKVAVTRAEKAMGGKVVSDYMDQREDVYAAQKKECSKYIGEPGGNCTECGMIAYEHQMDWKTPSETDAQKATAMIGAVINLTEGQFGTICGIIEAMVRRVR